MKKYFIIFLGLILISCSTSESNIEVLDTTSTSPSSTSSSDSTSSTTIESNVEEPNNESIDSYEYDMDKMSPFTGLELAPEIWLKRPRRVIAFKIDNNLNARPQSGLQEADTVMEILVEGCLLYTSPSPRDVSSSRMPSSA